MEDICVICKKSVKVACFCDNPSRYFDNNEETLEETNFQSFSFSKNSAEIQKQLQSTFNLFLKGHTSYVKSLALTHDNKYIISGSSDQ